MKVCRSAATVNPEPVKPEQDMNKYKSLLIPFLILLAIGVGTVYLAGKSAKKELSPTNVQKLSVSLTINSGTDTKSFDISGYIGKTALDATGANAKVETSGTGTNAFVTAIDNRAADSKKHEFWELLVNGKAAEVGAGSYIIQNGDQIQWHINTY